MIQTIDAQKYDWDMCKKKKKEDKEWEIRTYTKVSD